MKSRRKPAGGNAFRLSKRPSFVPPLCSTNPFLVIHPLWLQPWRTRTVCKFALPWKRASPSYGGLATQAQQCSERVHFAYKGPPVRASLLSARVVVKVSHAPVIRRRGCPWLTPSVAARQPRTGWDWQGIRRARVRCCVER